MPGPAKMTLTNLETGAPLEAQYNPTSVDLQLEALWNRVPSPGASYQELQYANTGNQRVSFELFFDGASATGFDLDAVQGYLLALLYPPRAPLAAKSGSPPRVLFSWPQWVALVCAAPKLSILSTRFDAGGAPTYLRVKVELEERRVTRLGTEDVRVRVLRRAA